MPNYWWPNIPQTSGSNLGNATSYVLGGPYNSPIIPFPGNPCYCPPDHTHVHCGDPGSPCHDFGGQSGGGC